jgi:hypothetical protein
MNASINFLTFVISLNGVALAVALSPLWRIAKALESLARSARIETGEISPGERIGNTDRKPDAQ